MKKLFIINILILIIPFSFQIHAQGTWDNYCYNFRWVDNNNGGALYSNGFPISFAVHNNIGTYTLLTPPTCPDISPATDPGCSINGDMFPYSCLNAASTWNNVGALPSLQTSGFISGPVVNYSDLINVIGFDDSQFAPGTDVIAFTKLWLSNWAYNCDDPNGIPNQPALLLAGFDIAFNPSKIFDVLEGTNETDLDYEAYDFESVILHEFGHALGLCHHPDANPNVDAMHGTTYQAQIRRTLSEKDIAALNALYPTQPPYPPCEVFTQGQGNDVGRKRGTGGGGGSGSTCYYIPPATFSAEATRQMVLFWERELGNNFNLLMRRFVQNTDLLNEVLTSSNTHYANLQAAFADAINTLKPLIESNFAQNNSTKITAAHINAVCCWVDELLPLFDELEFYREPLFLQELLNLQKGLNTLLYKDVKTALLNYDKIGNFSGLPACSCSGKRSVDNTMNFYVSTQQGYISLHSQLSQEAILEYIIYDTGGRMSGSIVAGQLPAGKHTENIQRGVLKTALYIIVPVIDGLPLRSNALKVSVF